MNKDELNGKANASKEHAQEAAVEQPERSAEPAEGALEDIDVEIEESEDD